MLCERATTSLDLIEEISFSKAKRPHGYKKNSSISRMSSACSLMIFGLWELVHRTDEVNASRAYFILMSLSTIFFFLFSIPSAFSTDILGSRPKSSGQYGFCLTRLVFFLDLVGYLPQGRPVTMANSLSDTLMGFSAKINQISCFLDTFSIRVMMYWPKLPENEGFSEVAMSLPNFEFLMNSTSSDVSELRKDSIFLGLWYELTLSPVGSCPAAKSLSGRHCLVCRLELPAFC